MNISNNGVTVDRCKVKQISRNHISADVAFTFSRKITTFFWHFTVFFKFSSNEYRQTMVNVWDDFCSYLAGDPKNMIVGRVFPTFQPYTNFNHTCPYEPGPIFMKIKNMSANEADPVYLVPSGRYRVDISWHEIFRGPPFAKLRIYGAISDHRIVKL